jgi:hypothetical protein
MVLDTCTRLILLAKISTTLSTLHVIVKLHWE